MTSLGNRDSTTLQLYKTPNRCQLHSDFVATGSNLTLGASLLTLLYSSNAETHSFSGITLRFLFQGEKKTLHKTSLVSLEGLDPPQTVMKRNALSHRAARLREPVLRHPIPNAWSRDQFFFFFLMIPSRSEKGIVLITPSSSQLEILKVSPP